MFKRLSIKVALLTNITLFCVVLGGMYYLVYEQSKNLENQLLERGKILSITAAKGISRIFEEAIDNGVFAVGDAFDMAYDPIPGFDPPKFHTKYDSYLDKAILSYEDEFLKDPSIIFAVAVDVNGYLPTHNTRYQRPPTGDKEKDLVGNRTKRIFNDPVGIAAAQNKEFGFLQTYYRDTGEKMWDISTPIYVKGKHWGGFRIGYSLVAVEKAKKKLVVSISAIMLSILFISIISVFIVVDWSLKPLRIFTKVASNLADGKMDEKIESKSKDEIGQIANVLERLRTSLKASMERLAKK